MNTNDDNDDVLKLLDVMYSIQGYQSRVKTSNGKTSRIQGWLFPDNYIKIRQVFFVEPEYEPQKHDIVMRETANYKVIERCLYLTLTSADCLFDILYNLLNKGYEQPVQ